jgi:hypothetical protein
VQTESADPETHSRSLRLTAARGRADFIVCYWGLLESGNDRLPTKAVSWVPIVNWLMPDERQHLRIHLKIAVVDVRSGNWSIFSPDSREDARITASPHRAAVYEQQVERLKRMAYEASVREFVQVFE